MQEIYQPHVAKSLDRRMLPPTCPDHRFGSRYLHGSFGRRFTVRTSQRKEKGLHGPQEEEEKGEGEELHDRRRIEEGGSCESSSVRSFVRSLLGRTDVGARKRGEDILGRRDGGRKEKAGLCRTKKERTWTFELSRQKRGQERDGEKRGGGA